MPKNLESSIEMAEDATALATLLFAMLAGIGSVIRCYQNERLWKHHKRTLRPHETHQNGSGRPSRYEQG